MKRSRRDILNEQELVKTKQGHGEAYDKPDYANEIISIIRGNTSPPAMSALLEDYHENDIAGVMSSLSRQDRKKLYRVLDAQMLSAVLEYVDEDDAGAYLEEIDPRKITEIIEAMETDSAVMILREVSRDKRALIMGMLPDSVTQSIELTASFDEEEIGSRMTANYIVLRETYTIKQAMSALIEQAAKNDNISTLFVVNDSGLFLGAIELKDLITARHDAALQDLIITSFPYVYAQETIDECLEKLKAYSESAIPVLGDDNRLLGVITAQTILQVTGDELGEDYARLAGLTAEEDLEEPIIQSIKKRLPWLLILLGLGLVVSSVVGAFEAVISQLTIIMAFQSLILDMAGNVGTQSLAVTIRVLTVEGLGFKQKLSLVAKEIRIGLLNGAIIGSFSVILVGLFIHFIKGQPLLFSFAVSGCIGLALMLAMIVSSATGTLIPMFFKKINIDPAVASGPLITTINDLVAVVTYYGLSWLLLLEILHLG